MSMKNCLLLVFLGCAFTSTVLCNEEAVTIADSKDEEKPAGKEVKEEEGVYKSWQLDTNRFVKVKEYRGKLYVDIREHYEKDGRMLPGKKGILLNLAQFKLFKDACHDINHVLEQCQGHDPNILNH